jgi:hypothetical protein
MRARVQRLDAIGRPILDLAEDAADILPEDADRQQLDAAEQQDAERQRDQAVRAVRRAEEMRGEQRQQPSRSPSSPRCSAMARRPARRSSASSA